MSLLIVDTLTGTWSIFDSNSLKEGRRGLKLARLPTKGIEGVGLIAESEDHAAYRELRHKFPKIPILLVSDSDFFRSLPSEAFSYLLPGPTVRKAGRHGLIHADLVDQAAAAMGKSPLELNLITLYLDNESSAAAVREGMAVDISTGLPGGQSVGNLELGDLWGLLKGSKLDRLQKLLNEESGLLGFSGLRGELDQAVGKPKLRENPKFALAMRIFLHQLVREVGGMQAILGRVDAVIFSGVIGEKSRVVKEELLRLIPAFKSGNVFTFPARPHQEAARQIRSQLPRPGSPRP